MSTGTVVVIGVVGVAAVGGLVYFALTRKVAIAAAAAKPQSTTDKIVGSISALAPVAAGIAKLWNS